MNNYKITIQYDGDKYKGWQKQSNTDNTICSKLENVLSKMCGEQIDIIGSGRTDAGVHALSQVANFHCDTQKTTKEILEYFNEYLPQNIRVTSIAIVSPRFHSRLNASKKTYMYRIDNAAIASVFNRQYAYRIDAPLDIEAMNKCIPFLLGEHDFLGFSSLKKTKKQTTRTIYSITINKVNGITEISYKGDGFLYNMVRILTGTLIEVGLHHMNTDDICTILNTKNRQLAGPTAPPHGLFLKEVYY